MNIENVRALLLECYSKDLCDPKFQDKWNEKNKCFDMDAITSLIINDYFNGDIGKIYVNEISHYFNLIDSEIIDLTISQFNCDMNYQNYQIVDREKNINGRYKK